MVNPVPQKVTSPRGATGGREGAPGLRPKQVLLAAQAPVAATSWARLPAALVVAATVVCLVLALRSRRGSPA
ncbi:hypothetical protein [Streptomyces sp. NPDC047024]|uniref:hypothetical protein n=1 Tax=Streptomyces sp. NPDC047024 TaxID=3155476 RepID=UPI0033CF04F4